MKARGLTVGSQALKRCGGRRTGATNYGHLGGWNNESKPRDGALCGPRCVGGWGRMSFNDSTSPLNRVPHPYLSYSAPPQTGTALMGMFLQGPTKDGKVSTDDRSDFCREEKISFFVVGRGSKRGISFERKISFFN